MVRYYLARYFPMKGGCSVRVCTTHRPLYIRALSCRCATADGAPRPSADFREYSGFVLSIMSRICAPVRDVTIRELGQRSAVVDVFRGIMEVRRPADSVCGAVAGYHGGETTRTV